MSRRAIVRILAALVALTGCRPASQENAMPETPETPTTDPYAPDRGWQRRPTPGFSCCSHCNRSWDQVERARDDKHFTAVDSQPGSGYAGSAFFAVCEPCYRELRAKGQRSVMAAYALALWANWRQMHFTDTLPNYPNLRVSRTPEAMLAAVDADWAQPVDAPRSMG